MISSEAVWSFAALAPAWPAAGALCVGGLALLQSRPRESLVVLLSHLAL